MKLIKTFSPNLLVLEVSVSVTVHAQCKTVRTVEMKMRIEDENLACFRPKEMFAGLGNNLKLIRFFQP